MELKITERPAGTKAAIKQIRREGNIPAILYSKGEKGEELVVEGGPLRQFLALIEPDALSTEIFTMQFNGKPIRAIIKDIQYKITTYEVTHLDLLELHDDIPITLSIPIKCINAVDCDGVKQGGTLRQVVRNIRVKCLPKKIPKFEIDVKGLGLGQAFKLADLPIESGVHPLVNLNQVAVVVARK